MAFHWDFFLDGLRHVNSGIALWFDGHTSYGCSTFHCVTLQYWPQKEPAWKYVRFVWMETELKIYATHLFIPTELNSVLKIGTMATLLCHGLPRRVNSEFQQHGNEFPLSSEQGKKRSFSMLNIYHHGSSSMDFKNRNNNNRRGESIICVVLIDHNSFPYLRRLLRIFGYRAVIA